MAAYLSMKQHPDLAAMFTLILGGSCAPHSIPSDYCKSQASGKKHSPSTVPATLDDQLMGGVGIRNNVEHTLLRRWRWKSIELYMSVAVTLMLRWPSHRIYSFTLLRIYLPLPATWAFPQWTRAVKTKSYHGCTTHDTDLKRAFRKPSSKRDPREHLR